MTFEDLAIKWMVFIMIVCFVAELARKWPRKSPESYDKDFDYKKGEWSNGEDETISH